MKTGEDKKIGRGFLAFLKARGRVPLLLGGLLLGVLLLIIGGLGEEKSESVDADTVALRVTELAEYEEKTERELEALCESVKGVSDVEVLVTFDTGYTVRYTEDGNKNPASVGSGSSEEALFDTILPPEIAGVGIVCRGGSNAAVQQALTELVSTALGIPANRVFVTGK